jgi:MFS family permease
MISYTLVGLASTPVAFTLFTLMGSLGGGFFPATQSVALELYSRRGEKETGRLFGALSVLQALGSVHFADSCDAIQFIKYLPQLANHGPDYL